MGKALVERLLARLPGHTLIAVGTNSEATAAMRKAGAVLCATGENPVIVNAKDADVIMGPMGLIAANSLLGEITPAMALSISESKAKKILIPVNRCGIAVAGVNEDLTLGDLMDRAVDMACAAADALAAAGKQAGH